MVVTYVLLLNFLTVYVKIVTARGQSAGVRSFSTFEAFQRLNAGGLELNLDPNYITGFSAVHRAGESSFIISNLKNNNYKAGYVVVPIFSIHLDIKDYLLLKQIKNYFQVGTLQIKNNKIGNRSVIYTVRSFKYITNNIIPHFYNYPLLTAPRPLAIFMNIKIHKKKIDLFFIRPSSLAERGGKKRADYLLFKEVLNLINQGKHLRIDGLKEILAYKAFLNNGLNVTLKKEFDITPVQRPEVKVSSAPQSTEVVVGAINTNWLIEFIEGEGSFICLVRKNQTHLIGFAVTLSFSLPQHSRDLDLMLKIQEFLGWEKIYERNSKVNLTITRRSEIKNLINILKGELRGAKKLDFEGFVEIKEIVNKDLLRKLSKEGLAQIIEIKKNTNIGRDVEN